MTRKKKDHSTSAPAAGEERRGRPEGQARTGGPEPGERPRKLAEEENGFGRENGRRHIGAPDEETQTISVAVPEDVYSFLEREAGARGVGTEEFAEMLVDDYLSRNGRARTGNAEPRERPHGTKEGKNRLR